MSAIARPLRASASERTRVGLIRPHPTPLWASVRMGFDKASVMACCDDVIRCRSRASGTGHTLVAGRGEHKQLWPCVRCGMSSLSD